MGGDSWKVSDFPSVSKGTTRTAQSLFGSQVPDWEPGQVGHVDTGHLFVRSGSPLCLLSLPTAPPHPGVL